MTNVTETENATISVIRKTEPNKETTKISATLENKDGWDDLENIVRDRLNAGVSGSLEVEVQTKGAEVTRDALGKFCGENVTLLLRSDEQAVWKIDMSGKQKGDFARKYLFGAEITRLDSVKTSIESDEVYEIRFAGKTDFPVQVGIRAGIAGQYASLYRKNELLTTVVIDEEGYAWFSMDKVEKGTKYYIGINVDGITLADAEIPESMYDQYGVDATLTDASGKQYEVGERSSSWGISGKRFAIYVAAVIAGIVLLVTIVMLTWHKLSASKEKYRRMAEEDEAPIDEEALRMEVMKELLEEQKKKEKKDKN